MADLDNLNNLDFLSAYVNETSKEIIMAVANRTFEEINCYLTYNQSVHDKLTTGPSRFSKICNATWDGVACWPPTFAMNLAILPCFSKLNGVPYDSTQNASRLCELDGTWAKANFSQCRELRQDKKKYQLVAQVEEAGTVYMCGYALSLFALVLALWIFLYFKDLRCVRNTIHINLMVTYVLFELTWITVTVLSKFQHDQSSEAASETWCILGILLTYFYGTNFFWMFVEGLYLYVLVVKTFSMELVNIHIYAFIGWGLPALIVLIWAPVKLLALPPEEGIGCPWQSRNHYDYIFVVPFLLVLAVNSFFLQKIMWVLITKLRAATTVESKQYRKAAKALLVLIPLLGVTYILTLFTPKSHTPHIIVTYVQATLQATQGFFVAVSYCFLNGEVRNSVRHHFQRWRSLRNLQVGKCYNGSRTYSSYLHNSEGTKIYRTRGERDRGSCISFTTTTTYVSNYHPGGRDTAHGQRNLSNGSGAGYDPVNTQIHEETL